jgi:LmbE family N-acetylglucosaminyl deacetylase
MVFGSVIFLLVSFYRTQADSGIQLQEINKLELKAYQRLLVFAPHPDDEILGAGAILSAMQAKGGEVKVVVVTNGDGQWFSPAVVSGDPLPSSQSFIKVGLRRQIESVQALKQLGISLKNLVFLGYPDGGLYDIWEKNWQVNPYPVVGRYTGKTTSPYPDTYSLGHEYSGSYLYQDIYDQIRDFKPDIIVFPHPLDQHKDHQAVSNFVQLAAGNWMNSEVSQPILLLSYLTHYGSYPQSIGPVTGTSLLPPLSMQHKDSWLYFELEPEQMAAKSAAIREFYSQTKVMRAYLNSFVRANELFYQIEPFTLSSLDFVQEAVIEGELSLAHTKELKSVYQQSQSRLDPSSQIIAWHAMRIGDLVCVGAETAGKLQQKYSYRISIKTTSGEVYTFENESLIPIFEDNRFAACLQRDWFMQENVFLFRPEVWNKDKLDQTSWHLVVFDEGAGPDMDMDVSDLSVY